MTNKKLVNDSLSTQFGSIQHANLELQLGQMCAKRHVSWILSYVVNSLSPEVIKMKAILNNICRCPWRSVKAAIETFDSAVFQTADDVSAVIKCLPTEEEQGLLQSFVSTGASLDSLTDAELFSIDLMQVLTCPFLAEQSILEHPVGFGKNRPTTSLKPTSLPPGQG